MKQLLILFFTFGAFGFLVACTAAPEKPTIHPTEGKLTFAFFFTDG